MIKILEDLFVQFLVWKDVLKGQCPGADILQVPSLASENWCFIWWIIATEKTEKQLMAAPHKQNSLRHSYMEEKYFAFFFFKEKHVINK